MPLMATLRFSRARARLQKQWESLTGTSPSMDMVRLQEFYREIWSDAAGQLQARFEELAPGFWRVSRDGRSTLISNFKVQLDDLVILNLAGDKGLVYRLLRQQGLPVPDHLCFRWGEMEKAREFMAGNPGGFFVVKPAAGTSGARGITTDVRTGGDLVAACGLASLYGPDLLVERYVAGEPYRLLILDGRLIHASRRRGRWVTGNGRSTLRELYRADGGAGGKERVFLSELAGQGLGPDAVPEEGRRVYVGHFTAGSSREVRTVFDEDATSLVCPTLVREAVLAAGAIGSRLAGVDVITVDPSVSLWKSGGVINEVNTTPGLHHHYNLSNQHAPPAAVAVLRYLLESSGRPPAETGEDFTLKIQESEGAPWQEAR